MATVNDLQEKQGVDVAFLLLKIIHYQYLM